MSDEYAKDLRPSARDAAIDEALDAATGRRPAVSPGDISFKRQWDDDLDAELEAAMAGFDASAIEVNSPGRLPRDQRAGGQAPRGGRGTDSRQGSQIGKVIAVRSKSIFVDLGGKSEGILPTDQITGDLPNPRRLDRDPRRPLRHRGRDLRPVAQGGGGRGQLGKPSQGPDRRGQGQQGEQGGVWTSRSTASAPSCRSARSTSTASRTPPSTSTRSSGSSSPRPTSARRTSSSLVGNSWSRSEPRSASRPGRRSKRGRSTREPCGRSRTSGPSSRSAASMA